MKSALWFDFVADLEKSRHNFSLAPIANTINCMCVNWQFKELCNVALTKKTCIQHLQAQNTFFFSTNCANFSIMINVLLHVRWCLAVSNSAVKSSISWAEVICCLWTEWGCAGGWREKRWYVDSWAGSWASESSLTVLVQMRWMR